jgi:energy-coupling factor transporter ATP-binding protein EcfA2
MGTTGGSGRLASTRSRGGRTVSIQADPAGSGSGQGGPAAQGDTVSAATHAAAGQSANGAASLSAVDLTLSCGARAILSGLMLDVHAGNVTALLGPTGSGKTTLLRTFNRMNDKVTGYRHKGDVLLDGRSIWSAGIELMALRRKVGMLFQRPNPFPMSILDNVIAGVKAHKMAPRSQQKEIAERRLREVGLWDAVSTRLKDSPFRLSGGQQQLLCLARRRAALQPGAGGPAPAAAGRAGRRAGRGRDGSPRGGRGGAGGWRERASAGPVVAGPAR